MSPQLENISLDLLKTLAVFVETGGVDETARRLKMTQAGVSMQLKKLQSEVGTPLFRAVGRRKVLTEFAKDLFQTIAPPLTEIERRLKEVSRYKQDPEKSLLRIGCRPEIMKRVTELLQFQGRVQFKSYSRTQSLQALRDDQIDIAVIQDPPSSTQLIARKLFRNRLCWIGNPQLFGKKSPKNFTDLMKDRESLSKTAVVAYKEDPPFLGEFAQKLKIDKLEIRFFCEEWNAIVALVAENRAWSIVPEDILTENNKVLVTPLEESIGKPVDFYMVYGAHLKASPLIKGLVREKLG